MNLPPLNPDYAVPALENATLIVIFFVALSLVVIAVGVVMSGRRNRFFKEYLGRKKKPIKPLDKETLYHNSIYKNGHNL
jgi:hypothetical protein